MNYYELAYIWNKHLQCYSFIFAIKAVNGNITLATISTKIESNSILILHSIHTMQTYIISETKNTLKIKHKMKLWFWVQWTAAERGISVTLPLAPALELKSNIFAKRFNFFCLLKIFRDSYYN